MKKLLFIFRNNMASARQVASEKTKGLWISIAGLLDVALSMTVLCMMATTANGQVVIVQEAERNYSFSGQDSASVMSRTNASNDRTLWVRNKGDEVSWTIDIAASANFSLVVRYSNDNFGALDSTSVKVNGNKVGEFENLDTGGGGGGWNVFVDSPIISLGQLPIGKITLSLRLDKTNNGVEYDKLTINSPSVINDQIVKSVPDNFDLMQNYPNPFNPSTDIRFGLPKASHVKLEVYDALGSRVAVLVDKRLTAGSHVVTFDGNEFPSGVYYYRLASKTGGSLSKAMLLIK